MTLRSRLRRLESWLATLPAAEPPTPPAGVWDALAGHDAPPEARRFVESLTGRDDRINPIESRLMAEEARCRRA